MYVYWYVHNDDCTVSVYYCLHALPVLVVGVYVL